MTTTHLFVELLVIGFGALLWIIVLGAAVFGYDHVALIQESRSLLTLLPLLSVAYVLGIVVDRVADGLFDAWDQRHRSVSFKDFKEGLKRYYSDRRILVVHGPELWAHLEYGRSRLRICRGWALNAVMLLVAVDVFVFARHLGLSWQVVTGNAALLLLSLACVVSWSNLNRKEYQKIKRQAQWLRDMDARRREPLLDHEETRQTLNEDAEEERPDVGTEEG